MLISGVNTYSNFKILYYAEDSNNLVQKRTKEVANFLSMLRSASGNTDEGSKMNEIPHDGWKVCFIIIYDSTYFLDSFNLYLFRPFNISLLTDKTR